MAQLFGRGLAEAANACEICDQLRRTAQEFRRQAKRSAPAIETRLEVEPGGRVLREKTTITFGDEGLPLSELSKVAATLRKNPSPATVVRQKVGRNEPCPCGSGKKYKQCHGK